MQEISDETERLCGGGDGKITISNVPISLKISSQKCNYFPSYLSMLGHC